MYKVQVFNGMTQTAATVKELDNLDDAIKAMRERKFNARVVTGTKKKTTIVASINSFGDVKIKTTRKRRSYTFADIQPQDRVTILQYAGMGRNGKEYREATGRVVMRSAHGGWVLNMGGAHGTPGLVDETNFVRIKR